MTLIFQIGRKGCTLYFSVDAGSVDDGLRPKGNVIGVAFEEFAIC